MKDIFEDFCWHSSMGLDSEISGPKRFITKMANTVANRSKFYSAGSDFLIHKTSQALWRVSQDGQSIEPVFDTEVLTEDQMED